MTHDEIRAALVPLTAAVQAHVESRRVLLCEKARLRSECEDIGHEFGQEDAPAWYCAVCGAPRLDKRRGLTLYGPPIIFNSNYAGMRNGVEASANRWWLSAQDSETTLVAVDPANNFPLGAGEES